MPKKVRVLSVGTEVVVVKDTVSHHIPKGTITKITFWDGSVTAPAYRLEGYDTGVWYTDIKPTSATTTQKPKEPKTMSTTKKSETSHGKSLHAPAKAPEAKAAAVPYRPTVGDVVRITKDTYNHCFPINSVFTIKKDDKSDLPYYPGAKKNPHGNWFTPGDCELITKSADVVKASKEAKATAKPKYPAARVQIAALAPMKPLDKMTKAELIEAYGVLKEQFDNQAADHCIAGTKLDRALVDLKEAKAKIKELTKGTEAVK